MEHHEQQKLKVFETEWGDYRIRHIESSMGLLEVYVNKKTGKAEKMITHEKNGEMETWELDPKTEKSAVFRRYDADGNTKEMYDIRGLEKALRENPIFKVIFEKTTRKMVDAEYPGVNSEAAHAEISEQILREIMEQTDNPQ